MGLKDFFIPAKSMEAHEAKDYIKNQQEGSFTVLDVRQPHEYEQEHIPGAKLIPLPGLADSLAELDPQKPTIVYCAVGGRSRVAVQLLSGKGFKQVYNLKGGIKAWHGHKAEGPHELHLKFLTKYEKPAHMISFAYHMEETLQGFYVEVQHKSHDQELGKLLSVLADYEENHKKRIIELCRELGLAQPDTEHGNKDILEGGFDKETFLRDNEPHLTSARDVLTVAMMLETQSLDLYLRLADEVPEEKTKKFLLTMAGEEKQHLALLGDLLDKKV